MGLLVGISRGTFLIGVGKSRASKASNGASLTSSSTSPDQIPNASSSLDPPILSSTRSPDPSTSTDLSNSAHLSIPDLPSVVSAAMDEVQVASTRGRQRVLTAAGKLVAEETAKTQADRLKR